MKFGVRTPSIKKSIKARTTGRAKRVVKSAVNPTYGKKGMGYIKNPKKAIYNTAYSKTTVDAMASLKESNTKKTIINGEAYKVEVKVKDTSNINKNSTKSDNVEVRKVNKWIALLLCFYLGVFGVHKFYEGNKELGELYLYTFGLFTIGWFIDLFIILFRPNPYYVEINNNLES